MDSDNTDPDSESDHHSEEHVHSEQDNDAEYIPPQENGPETNN